MPMKGKPISSNKHGVKREIYFYQATSLQQVQGNTPLFDKVNTPLILKPRVMLTDDIKPVYRSAVIRFSSKKTANYLPPKLMGQVF